LAVGVGNEETALGIIFQGKSNAKIGNCNKLRTTSFASGLGRKKKQSLDAVVVVVVVLLLLL